MNTDAVPIRTIKNSKVAVVHDINLPALLFPPWKKSRNEIRAITIRASHNNCSAKLIIVIDFNSEKSVLCVSLAFPSTAMIIRYIKRAIGVNTSKPVNTPHATYNKTNSS